MSDPLRRHKYALNRILIPAARILVPEFNAIYVFLTGSHVELLRNLIAYATRETTFVDEYHDDYYTIPDDTDRDSIAAIVAELEYILMGTVLGDYDAYVCVRDKKPQNIPGGSFLLGAWRTRDINDEQADAENICSLSSNQITLAAGTYRCIVTAPAFKVGLHQLRLYNITDTVVLLVGCSDYADAAQFDQTHALLVGRFTLAAEKTLEVQHRCTTTYSSQGFGASSKFTDEIYATAEFWREN